MLKRFVHPHYLLVAATVAVVAASSLAAVAHAGPEAPVVPATIQVDEGNKVFLVGHAVGVQIYSCNPTATGYGWTLVAPRADLYDDHGNVVVKHFGGPTWQATDGSRVVGQVLERYPVDGTIPWLKLEAAPAAAGAEGDRLAATTFIQRLATTGGLAPAAAACNAGTAGTVSEIPYTADYYFWKATGR